MQPLRQRLQDRRPLVGDGALGTMLLGHGLLPGRCPEELSRSRPELLTEIAQQYIDAGADIIETNTFGGSPLKLDFSGLADQTVQINQAAVHAVRAAADGRAYVAGSCGPTGKLLEPYGDTPPTVIADAFRVQIGALLDAGVDAICVETMTDLHEARLAVEVARELDPNIPVFATMTFDQTPRGFFTIMGTTIEQAATTLADAGATVVGSNCGHGIGPMIAIAKRFIEVTSLPCLIQANAGMPETRGSDVVYPDDPDTMAQQARELVRMGVRIIGGCCGTTPDHIRALRTIVADVR